MDNLGLNYMDMVGQRPVRKKMGRTNGVSAIVDIPDLHRSTPQKKGIKSMNTDRDVAKPKSSIQMLGELPELFASLSEQIAALTASNERNNAVQEAQLKQSELLLTRIDGMASELHALVILMSEMVTFQSYMMDNTTLDSDSRSHREKVANLVENGD